MASQPQSWSTQQLAEFLDLIASAPDEVSARRDAVDRVAEALDAEIAAIVLDGITVASIGFPGGDSPDDQLAAVAAGEVTEIDIAGIGRVPAGVAPIHVEPPGSLVVARLGGSGFAGEEVVLLRGMARAFGMTVGMLRGLAKERRLREQSEVEARERRQAEAKYRTLVERLPAIVYRAEPGKSGRWHYVSPQIEQITGFTPQEWTSDPDLWARQILPEDREHALSMSVGGPSPAPVDYRMLTRDGRVIWILDEAVLQLDESGEPVWHGVLYDITARKTAEQELERRTAQGAAVARLGEQALRGVDPDSLIEATVRLVAEIEKVSHACVYEFEPTSDELKVRAALDGSPLAPGTRTPALGTRTPAGLALRLGRHVLVDDWESDAFQIPKQLHAIGVRSCLAVVIGGKAQPFGVLEVHSTEPRRFSSEDVHFVRAAANILADAIERRSTEEAIRHRALHDPLTGLPNRPLFEDRIEGAIARARRRDGGIAVLFCDLDHLKIVNDSLGHHSGDELLRAVGQRLRETLRTEDTVARFGGDEFGVLLEDVERPEDAALTARRIEDALRAPFILRGSDHFITASIGIALAQNGEIDAGELVRDADSAMYRAKERGRARIEIFDEQMRAQAVERLEVERELRHAIDRDELVPHYQPVVSLSNGEMTGFEVLLRWQHPTRGLLNPAEFIPIAEASRLIDVIGPWVVEQACRKALDWQQLRGDAPPLEISVNVSARELGRPEFPAIIAETLAKTGLDPSLLSLEITESALIEDTEMVAEAFRVLSNLGVKLALDDFGTGYSSLSYLERFPLDVLKVDRTFVEGLGNGQGSDALVDAIVAMARALSLDVVAEGVETENQADYLRRVGCDRAQGFLFWAAMPAEEIEKLLSGSKRPKVK